MIYSIIIIVKESAIERERERVRSGERWYFVVDEPTALFD